MWIEIRVVCRRVLIAAVLLTWSYLIMADHVFDLEKSNDFFAGFSERSKETW